MTLVDFKICPGPLHCEGCAGNAELTALRAELAAAKILRAADEKELSRLHARQCDLNQECLDLKADLARAREALEAAASSLHTLSLAGGRDQPIMADPIDVRGYAANRERVARAALKPTDKEPTK